MNENEYFAKKIVFSAISEILHEKFINIFIKQGINNSHALYSYTINICFQEEHDQGAPVLDSFNKAMGILFLIPPTYDQNQTAVHVKLVEYRTWINTAKIAQNLRDPYKKYRIVRGIP